MTAIPPSWTVRLWPALALAASIAGLGAESAGAAPPPPSPLAQTCRSILGLRPGEAHFAGCVASLSDALNRLGGARAAEGARQACLQRGLKPGDATFAMCAVEAAAEPTEVAVAQATEAPAASSFFYASNEERRRRQQLACASLGLNPSSRAFDSCVAGLAATLFGVENPQN